MADAEEQQYVYVVTDGSDTAGSLAQLSDQIVIARDTIEDFNQDEEADDLTDEASNNIWSKCNSALSDLLVFLVNKYNADEVKSSQVKSQHWDKLIQEFYQFTGHQQLVSKQQIIRKWHNWKQYNKSKKKPHPFALVGNLTEDKVRSKCQMLLNKLPKENQVSYLESIGGGGGDEDTDVNLQVPLSRLNRVRQREFLVRRTGASATALSLKRLEHEIIHESLTNQHEKWRIAVENQSLRKEKLMKKLALSDVKYEKAKLELELLKNQFGLK